MPTISKKIKFVVKEEEEDEEEGHYIVYGEWKIYDDNGVCGTARDPLTEFESKELALVEYNKMIKENEDENDYDLIYLDYIDEEEEQDNVECWEKGVQELGGVYGLGHHYQEEEFNGCCADCDDEEKKECRDCKIEAKKHCKLCCGYECEEEEKYNFEDITEEDEKKAKCEMCSEIGNCNHNFWLVLDKPDERLVFGLCGECDPPEDEEEDVCCVGCNKKVCSFNEEPPNKDSRGEAVCDDCGEEEEYEKCEKCDIRLGTYDGKYEMKVDWFNQVLCGKCSLVKCTYKLKD